MTTAGGPAGDAEIIDVRYSRYDGARLGRGAAVWSLAHWGALRALGARRGWKAKVIPIVLCLAALGPALVVLGVRALFSEFSDRSPIDITEALPYSDYQSVIGVVILLFAVVLAPELLCPDRRDGTLALYFSTAVGRGEYVLGRFLAVAVPLLLVTLVPMLVLFAGVTFFDDEPFTYLREEWAQLPRILASGLLLAVYYAVIGLVVSSFTGRRAYAIGGYVLLLIATTGVAGLISGAVGEERYIEAAQLSTLPILFARTLFPGSEGEIATPGWFLGLAYLVVVGAAAYILVRRYMRERV